MSEEQHTNQDEQPAPLEHSDAERVPDAEEAPEGQADEVENDPAPGSGAGSLRDTKGG